jgi:hypothetical protein
MDGAPSFVISGEPRARQAGDHRWTDAQQQDRRAAAAHRDAPRVCTPTRFASEAERGHQGRGRAGGKPQPLRQATLRNWWPIAVAAPGGCIPSTWSRASRLPMQPHHHGRRFLRAALRRTFCSARQTALRRPTHRFTESKPPCVVGAGAPACFAPRGGRKHSGFAGFLRSVTRFAGSVIS